MLKVMPTIGIFVAHNFCHPSIKNKKEVEEEEEEEENQQKALQRL